MADWNPSLYLQFESERTRPAEELLARIFHPSPRHISDLGCGPGNSTELLHRRYPTAQTTGVDSSKAMLEKAAKRLPGCHFVEADIGAWRPDVPQDVIYANASLQWVPHHEVLMSHLLDQLADGGVLAFQVPDNLLQPSHALMCKVALEGEWKGRYGEDALSRKKLLTTEEYYDLMASRGCRVDVWRTTFYHVMPSVAAIVEWVKSTGLRPFLNPLNEEEQALFIQRYLAELTQAYGVRSDGSVLLAFPRLFVVASKVA